MNPHAINETLLPCMPQPFTYTKRRTPAKIEYKKIGKGIAGDTVKKMPP